MKNYLTELTGTFFLVLVIALSGNPFAIGAMLMVMVYMGGPVSGAHYNPAVTFAIWLRGKIEMKEAAIYMLVQLIGAMVAAYFYYLLAGGQHTFVASPNTDINIIKPLLVEMVFTFALASVVLSVATSKKSAGNNYFGMAIGFTIMAAAMAGGKISGGAYNPAVGVGPILVDTILGGDSIKHVWIYLVGPFAGGIIAALVYKYLTNADEFVD
jgi:aquaporin Z